MHDVKGILGSHFMLRHLSPGELDRLVPLVTTRHYEAGAKVFLKGDPGTAMMAVLSGRVRICSYSAEGREVVLNVMSPGDVFGEIALIDGGERTADAFAMEATELLILSRRDFLPFLTRHPDICIGLLEVLCSRLRWTTEQLEDLQFLDLRSRLAKRLLYLNDHHSEVNGADNQRRVRISQHLLASMIGTSREAVNKQLSEWRDQSLIKVGRGSISILDRDRLAEILEQVD